MTTDDLKKMLDDALIWGRLSPFDYDDAHEALARLEEHDAHDEQEAG